MSLSSLARSAQGTWAVCNAAGVPLAEFDTFLKCDVKVESRVADAPVEKESFASYNKTPYPGQVNVVLAKTGAPTELTRLLDALGTFADSRVLETLNEDSANVAYELTFLLAGVVCFIYVVLVKKQPLLPRQEAPKYTGAIFETAGQFAYIYAIADQEHVALAAPIISAYCAASVLWSRVILREKLSWKHYAMILLVVIGIVIMGIFDV